MVNKKRSYRGRNNSAGGGPSPGGKPRVRRRRRGPSQNGAPGAVMAPDGEYPVDEMMEGGEEGQPAGAPEIPLEENIGILELHPNGYGFLRTEDNNYSRERSDPFVPGTMIERFGLRQGVKLRAMVQQARRQQGPRVRELIDVDGMAPEAYLDVKPFDSLTPINPEQWLNLEIGQSRLQIASLICWRRWAKASGH